jgi:GntR family transcriptional regulator
VPTPRTGTPRYRQVAEELRRRIEAGAIPAGSLLPAESALVRGFGISRGTAREAIAVLRSEGLVVTEHGRGTYVRPRLPRRRLDARRYRPATHCDHSQLKLACEIDAQFGQVAATPDLAQLFEVEPGTSLLECRSMCYASGIPQQLSTSYYLSSAIANTLFADLEYERSNTKTEQLELLGIAATSVHEVVRARLPTAEEEDALRLPKGTPVIAITRRAYAGERIVEVTHDLVLPGDRTELEYDIQLDGS